MKKVTFLGILSAALVFGALFGPLKADAQPNSADWNGLYAGPNIGIARNYDAGVDTCVNPSGVVYGTGCVAPAFGNLTSQGSLAGGQLGYNFQFSHFVVGPEFDWDASTLGGQSAFYGPIPDIGGGSTAGGFTEALRVGSLASGRLRLGWASSKTLIYVTGGYIRGYGNAQSNLFSGLSTIQYPSNESFQLNGTTEGVGGEWKIRPKTSIKLELTEFHLPDFTTLAPASSGGIGYLAGKNFQFRGFTLRTGVNFQI